MQVSRVGEKDSMKACAGVHKSMKLRRAHFCSCTALIKAISYAKVLPSPPPSSFKPSFACLPTCQFQDSQAR